MTTNLNSNNKSTLGSLFHALPGLYLVLSPELIVLDATDAYLKAALTSREQLIGRQVLQAFPNNPDNPGIDSVHELEQSLRHVLQHRETHKMPITRYDIPDRTGSTGRFEERYWSSSNTPVFDEAGNLLYILHETSDITDQMQQEQNSLHHQEHLTMLSSAINAVSWELDVILDTINWDDNLYDVFGYSPQEFGTSSDAWASRVHPDDLQATLDTLEQAKATGTKVFSMEYRFAKASGEYAHVIDKCYVIYNRRGDPVRMIGSIIDVSVTKQAEQALKESDKRFQHLLELLPHMAWIAYPNGKVSFFNQNWYSYTGMPLRQTEGWARYIHPEDAAHVITAWHEALTTGFYEQECRIQNCMDGQYSWFLKRAEPMYDHAGNIKLWIGTFTDINEQKQALEQIQLRDRRLDNILKLSPANLCLLQGPNHICRFITPGVYSMFGNRRYLGRPAHEVWPELEIYDFSQLLNKVYQQGKTIQVETYRLLIEHPDTGQTKEAWYDFKYQPISDTEGQIEGVLVSAVEVTDLILAKQRITELELALQKLRG